MVAAQPPTLPSPSTAIPGETPAAVAIASARSVTPVPATIAWFADEGKVVVSLKDGSQIRGALDGLGAVEISTDFGQLSIPVKLVERITLNEDVNLSTVEYKGDRLTGVIELPALRMSTSWGDVSIKADQLKRFPLHNTGVAPYDPYAPSPVYPVPTPPYAPPVVPSASAPGYATAAVPGAPTAPPAPENLRLVLKDKSILVGKLRAPEKIPIRLAFAEIEIPAESISWMKRGDGFAKVRLANGDRVSGKLDVDEWTIEGVLGTIRVDAEKVLFVRRGRGRQHWIARPVTETTPGGGTVTRHVWELVEVFDDDPPTPVYSRTTPPLSSPTEYPARPPTTYAP
jgi:hypothetical protein